MYFYPRKSQWHGSNAFCLNKTKSIFLYFFVFLDWRSIRINRSLSTNTFLWLRCGVVYICTDLCATPFFTYTHANLPCSTDGATATRECKWSEFIMPEGNSTTLYKGRIMIVATPSEKFGRFTMRHSTMCAMLPMHVGLLFSFAAGSTHQTQNWGQKILNQAWNGDGYSTCLVVSSTREETKCLLWIVQLGKQGLDKISSF